MIEEKYKILGYLDQVQDSYKEPVERISGLFRDPKDIIRTIEFYSNDKYLSGNTDALGREKPFYNVGNYRVTVAKTATDLDVKDIRFEPDSLKFSIQAMLLNHELFKFLKESGFSLTLNEMGVTRPKYGGVIVKKYESQGKLEIGVCDWVNMDFDPGDIVGGILIETFHLSPAEMMKKDDVWYDVDEVLKAHAKATKGKPSKIMVKEMSGEFPVSFYNECARENYKETEKDKYTFERMCFYIAIVGTKKFVLYYKKEKESRYKYLPWEKVGLGLGRGVVEEGFESQVWQNDAMISMKNSNEISGKVLAYSDDPKMEGGNLLAGVDNGHIFKITKGSSFSSLTLRAADTPQLERVIKLWDDQFNKSASTFDANVGNNPPANQPYSSTALLNAVANSPFEYRREEWGTFLNEILNEWIFPHLKKKIMAPHYLVSEFSPEELDMIDEAIANFEVNKVIFQKNLDEEEVTAEDQASMTTQVKSQLRKFGKKREIKIPEKFLDVKGNITANITGELKNKEAVLKSLDSIFKAVAASFNPQTGQYALLENPVLAELFGQIVELSGVPFSSGKLRPSPVKTPSSIVEPKTLENTNGQGR